MINKRQAMVTRLIHEGEGGKKGDINVCRCHTIELESVQLEDEWLPPVLMVDIILDVLYVSNVWVTVLYNQ